MPSARSSMLDRADTSTSSPADLNAASRPVAFRGAGFAPRAGRYSGWIALLLVIGLWQLAGSIGWINPLFLPSPAAIAVGFSAGGLTATTTSGLTGAGPAGTIATDESGQRQATTDSDVAALGSGAAP